MDSRLQTQPWPVDDLVLAVTSGRIRIPSFQRGLRWTRGDVIRLFDSIVKGYPIGNLLLWRREGQGVEKLKIGALEIEAQATDQALFVVDGQQRLTSLANALSDQGQSDPRFALSLDVSRNEFVPSGEVSPLLIPLPVIFDLTRLLRWFGDYPELQLNPGLIERANSVAKAIREYRVPVYVVDQSDPDVLRDIFDRMNNYGKQLTRAEVFSALHESSSGERTASDDATDFDEIASNVHAATGFGVLDQDTIFLALLARRGADVSRDIRKEFAVTDLSTGDGEFGRESPQEARDRLTTAMIRAIRFLQEDARVPHFAFLPYRYLLVVLTRFFAHFPDPDSATLRNLRRWFWRAASLGPELTKGNITHVTRTLSARVVPGDSVESIRGLLLMVGDVPPSIRTATQFRTNYAATRLLLSAFWDAHPCRLDVLSEKADQFSTDALLASLGEGNSAVSQTPWIFRSSGTLPLEARALPSNRVFLPEMPSELPESVYDLLKMQAQREQYGSSAAREVLDSHIVSIDAARLLLAGEKMAFLKLRQADLERRLLKFIAREAEWKFEDTPPLDSFDLDDVRDDSLGDD